VSLFAAATAVLAVGIITYLSRAGLILFLADRPLPPNLLRALRYVGPAVLTALTVNLLAGGQGIGGVDVEEVGAVAVSIVVARLTHNLIVALSAGLVTLWVLLALL
jgi:branched-subunit amino acid transport protein